MKRTKTDFENHLERVKNCKTKFILCQDCKKVLNLPLFTQEKFKIFPVSCKSYFCETCAKRKIFLLKNKIKLALKNENWRFLTLTTAKSKFTFYEALQKINFDFNTFLTNIRKKYPDLKYFKVLEISKNKSVHLHILINKYIPAELIKKYWYMDHKSFIIKIEKAEDNFKVLNYLLKYFYKNFSDNFQNEIFYLNKKRRYSVSHNLFKKFVKEKIYKLLSEKPLSLENFLIFLSNKLSKNLLNFSELKFFNFPNDEIICLQDTFG